jgi:hypothetical protein
MFKYNNTHIFTGYLKQFLSSFNLPACKIYTQEFAKYLEQHGKEDPRIVESFDNIMSKDIIDENGESAAVLRTATHINYLKNDGLYYYFSTSPSLVQTNSTKQEWQRDSNTCSWQRSSEVFYANDKTVRGLTRTLVSAGNNYDTTTHEYLGDYLRFMRDYYGINLMSLYNCFTNKICNNLYYKHKIKEGNINFNTDLPVSDLNPEYIDAFRIFDSQDSGYKIYAIPVKLFAEYTIALDCDQGIEMFCGFYNTKFDWTDKAEQLANKTYVKVGKTFFKQPFLYDKLNISHWPEQADFDISKNQVLTDVYTRWDIISREQDLRLFIKVPVSCRSTITVLEGDYRTFNDTKFSPVNGTWVYQQNHTALNFNTRKKFYNNGDGVDLNSYSFKPISKLQLLAFNTGESYPFADRLVEYLSGSAITPQDEISDNIKRVQRVMEQNKNYFRIEGLWEDKMQNILYDYVVNSGPIYIKDGNLVDKHSGLNPKNYGYHKKLGHTSKSTLYDILGYVDRDTEKWYASWKKEKNKTGKFEAQLKDSIQNVDIYDGRYDI